MEPKYSRQELHKQSDCHGLPVDPPTSMLDTEGETRSLSIVVICVGGRWLG